MSSSSRMFLFAAVLTVGICAASQFRKPPGTSADSGTAPPPQTPFAHRLDGPRVVVGPALSEAAPHHVADAAPNRPAAPRAALASGANPNSPPDFPASSAIGSFPLSAPPAWPTGERTGDNPRRAANAPRLHRVEDGDTLALLAERYFGDAARAQEIHAANRDNLPPSGALPIGIDLTIPPATGIPRAVPAQPTTARTDATTLSRGQSTLWHGLPTVPPDSRSSSNVSPTAPSPFAEPITSPADSANAPLDNPVAPGVIRPASEPMR